MLHFDRSTRVHPRSARTTRILAAVVGLAGGAL